MGKENDKGDSSRILEAVSHEGIAYKGNGMKREFTTEEERDTYPPRLLLMTASILKHVNNAIVDHMATSR